MKLFTVTNDGLVPSPGIPGRFKFLRGDSSWQEISSNNQNIFPERDDVFEIGKPNQRYKNIFTNRLQLGNVNMKASSNQECSFVLNFNDLVEDQSLILKKKYNQYYLSNKIENQIVVPNSGTDTIIIVPGLKYTFTGSKSFSLQLAEKIIAKSNEHHVIEYKVPAGNPGTHYEIVVKSQIRLKLYMFFKELSSKSQRLPTIFSNEIDSKSLRSENVLSNQINSDLIHVKKLIADDIQYSKVPSIQVKRINGEELNFNHFIGKTATVESAEIKRLVVNEISFPSSFSLGSKNRPIYRLITNRLQADTLELDWKRNSIGTNQAAVSLIHAKRILMDDIRGRSIDTQSIHSKSVTAKYGAFETLSALEIGNETTCFVAKNATLKQHLTAKSADFQSLRTKAISSLKKINVVDAVIKHIDSEGIKTKSMRVDEIQTQHLETSLIGKTRPVHQMRVKNIETNELKARRVVDVEVLESKDIKTNSVELWGHSKIYFGKKYRIGVTDNTFCLEERTDNEGFQIKESLQTFMIPEIKSPKTIVSPTFTLLEEDVEAKLVFGAATKLDVFRVKSQTMLSEHAIFKRMGATEAKLSKLVCDELEIKNKRLLHSSSSLGDGFLHQINGTTESMPLAGLKSQLTTGDWATSSISTEKLRLVGPTGANIILEPSSGSYKLRLPRLIGKTGQTLRVSNQKDDECFLSFGSIRPRDWFPDAKPGFIALNDEHEVVSYSKEELFSSFGKSTVPDSGTSAPETIAFAEFNGLIQGQTTLNARYLRIIKGSNEKNQKIQLNTLNTHKRLKLKPGTYQLRISHHWKTTFANPGFLTIKTFIQPEKALAVQFQSDQELATSLAIPGAKEALPWITQCEIVLTIKEVCDIDLKLKLSSSELLSKIQSIKSKLFIKT